MKKSHLLVAVIAYFLITSAAQATIADYDSEAEFLSIAPIASTETFDKFNDSVPTSFKTNTIEIDSVLYTAAGKPGSVIWTVTQDGLGVPDYISPPNTLISNQINDHTINFGNDGYVGAFGFWLMSGGVFPLPSWIITITEIDGNVQTFSIVFTVGNERVYRGFASDTGIREIRVSVGPSNPPGGSSNWGYDNVSRSTIQTVPPIAGKGHPFIRCPGDVNSNGTADIAVMLSDGYVRIFDIAGLLLSRFSFNDVAPIADLEIMSDINANGANELVALGADPNGQVEVRDSLTGSRISMIDYDPGLTLMDLELVNDQTGNGIPELASLGQGPVKVEVKDALRGNPVNTIVFNNYFFAKDLEVYPDLNGNGVPELAVLGDNRNASNSDKLEIRDLATGDTVHDIWLWKGWQVLEQELIADRNGNGYPEAAVLRVRNADDAVNVLFRDTRTGQSLGSIGFDRNYPPKKLLTIADVNGNGSDEVVVFGRRFNGGSQKAQVKDSKTKTLISQVFFDKNYAAQDIVTCADMNGNGTEELVLLGRRSDGKLKAIIKDAMTGEQIFVLSELQIRL